jgi:hypothetical protein
MKTRQECWRPRRVSKAWVWHLELAEEKKRGRRRKSEEDRGT